MERTELLVVQRTDHGVKKFKSDLLRKFSECSRQDFQVAADFPHESRLLTPGPARKYSHLELSELMGDLMVVVCVQRG